MFFKQIEDRYLSQYAYLIGCQQTKEALLIDPERDIDRYRAIAQENNLEITAVAETHIHADFLSGAREFASVYGTKVYLSNAGTDDWKYEWAAEDGLDVQLLEDGDTFHVGNVEISVLATPGHTPEHLSFLLTDRGGDADKPMGIISGDFVFVGDVGRPDLLESAAGKLDTMKPAARQLYQSVLDFLELDDYLQVWPGHGAGSACGKSLGAIPETTVGYERRFSPAIHAAEDAETFTEFILEGQPTPPVYFARMKELNKSGPPLLRSLPQPALLNPSALSAAAHDSNAAVLDLRTDREAFARSHVAGSIYAPFKPTFTTIAGSYVEPDQAVYLITPPEDLEEAVRCLVRVGLDNVKGYATPEVLDAYVQEGYDMADIERITFEEVDERRQHAHVVDVRSLSEYDEAHIPGAQLAPHVRLQEEIANIPREQPLLVHCGSGARASSAASYLKRHNFEVVLVDDIFANWKKQATTDSEQVA